MCGRYQQAGHVPTITLLIDRLERDEADSLPPGNLAPTMQGAVILREGARYVQRRMRWGLVPHFAKEIGTFATFNARGETVATSPAFRSAFRNRRCLVPCQGFYEWKAVPGQKKKVPHLFTLKSGEPFVMAGLWDRATIGGEELLSYTIVTTTPNELVAQYHHRMAVMLHERDIERWLDPGFGDVAALQELLVPYPAELMSVRPVVL